MIVTGWCSNLQRLERRLVLHCTSPIASVPFVWGEQRRNRNIPETDSSIKYVEDELFEPSGSSVQPTRLSVNDLKCMFGKKRNIQLHARLPVRLKKIILCTNDGERTHQRCAFTQSVKELFFLCKKRVEFHYSIQIEHTTSLTLNLNVMMLTKSDVSDLYNQSLLVHVHSR